MDSVDHDRILDWGHASADYARYRTGYPPSFFNRLSALGIGISGQRILDLGTGTGNLAREFARRGCSVAAIDISEQQIAEALRLAAEQNLQIDFRVALAEQTGLPDHSFDVITASQSWLYFDRDRAVAETKRLLTPEGRLMTCHLAWLPRRDAIAKQTEDLILKYNPDWTAANLSGHISSCPAWIGKDFYLTGFFLYDEAIPFTRKTWRGRIRACRAIGGELSAAEMEKFDAEHAALLARTTRESFTILHWIDCHILAPVSTS
ncbi:MAG: class I SAM-dependent methyltransferase [Candidatus Acidiferrales bacterium]